MIALGVLSARGGFPLLVAVLLLPLSELAVGMVNQVLTLFLPPRVLPKLDVKNGIATEHATFVVIPSMLARPGKCGGAAGTAGASLSGQPRPEPSIRPAHGLYRRPARDDAAR